MWSFPKACTVSCIGLRINAFLLSPHPETSIHKRLKLGPGQITSALSKTGLAAVIYHAGEHNKQHLCPTAALTSSRKREAVGEED